MPRYAQVDENGYVVSDSYLSGAVEAENLIPLATGFDLGNKRWNGEGWEEYEPAPLQPDQTQADMDYLKMMLGGVGR